MPEFSTWEDLVNATEQAASDILMTDVAPVAEDILRKHIETDIYGAYTPIDGGWFAGRKYESAYERRHVLENNIRSELENPTTLMTTSYATANQSLVPGYHFVNRYPGAFLQLLESGHMGIWSRGFARPAVSNAQREIDHSTSIKRAIKSGIKRVIG